MNKKKLFCTILAVALIAVCVFAQPTVTGVAMKDGYFTYTVENGKAVVSGCDATAAGEITIPQKLGDVPVASIADRAFADCAEITSIVIPEGVTAIGKYAFADCKKLASVSVPDSLTVIGADAFDGCESLAVSIYGNTKYLYLGNPDNPYMVLVGVAEADAAEYVIHPETKVIAANAFADCKNLTSVELPAGAVSIGDCAFRNCTSLENITLSAAIDNIGANAFENCVGLTELSIPASLAKIGENAFLRCTNIQDVYVSNLMAWWSVEFSNAAANPLGVTASSSLHILDAQGKEVTKVVLDKNVTAIPDYGFKGCKSLTSVTFSGSVAEVGLRAFFNCSNLTDVYITDPSAWCKIQFIGDQDNPMTYAKQLHIISASGKELTELKLDDTVTAIPSYRFQKCTKLKKINIGANVTNIGVDAFVGCTNLNSIVVASKNTAYCSASGVLFTKDKSQLLLAPKTLAGTYIIADSVNNICTNAFAGCTKLVTVLLPAGVVVEENAFADCDAIERVFFKGAKAEDSAIKSGNEALADATWHYEVEATKFAEQNCYYCADCDEYLFLDGERVPATIVFKNWDGTVIEEKVYYYKDTIVAPEAPGKVHDEPQSYEYVFDKWDAEVTPCTGNATYTACYNELQREYTVTFVDEKGTVISSKKYAYGDTVEIPNAPEKAADKTFTYDFAGWDAPVTACIGDITYTATYKATYKNYTVVFIAENGEELAVGFYHYGDPLVVPAAPFKEADNTYTYEFEGWGTDVSVCVGDAAYTAIYKATYIEYTVTFQHGDGTVIDSFTLHYGDKVKAPVNPTAYSEHYVFSAWDNEVVDCEGDAVYTAEFVLKYKAGDADMDGTVDNIDVSYLLGSFLFPEYYHVEMVKDLNADGVFNDKDVAYLLGYTLFPAEYPIENKPVITQ